MDSVVQALDIGTDSITASVGALVLIAARLVPVFILVPCFGGRLVPSPVRVAVALAFALLLLPSAGGAVLAAWERGLAPTLLFALWGKEMLVGLTLGFVVSLPFFAVDAAGRLADVARGASQSQLLNSQTDELTTPLGDFGLLLAVVVFLFLDGHLLVVRALAASYEAIPLMTSVSVDGWSGAGGIAIRSSARLIAAAIGLAAPVLAAMFLSDLALGLINRVAPQVQVYFVGMPGKALLGVLAFLLGLAALTSAMAGETVRGVDVMLDAARSLSQ